MNELIITVFAVIAGLTVILFLLGLLLKKNVQEIKFDPAKYNSKFNENDFKNKVDELLVNNNKIQAINYLKENKKLSLIEAKSMIENYAKNNSPSVFNTINKIQTAANESDLIGPVKALLNQGKKIEAIKLVVRSRKIGLLEAKNFVDSLG